MKVNISRMEWLSTALCNMIGNIIGPVEQPGRRLIGPRTWCGNLVLISSCRYHAAARMSQFKQETLSACRARVRNIDGSCENEEIFTQRALSESTLEFNKACGEFKSLSRGKKTPALSLM